MSWHFSSTVQYNNKEIPVNMDALMELASTYQPEDEYQALMEAKPFEEPETPKNVCNILQEIISECLEILLDQDKFIILAINYEQITYEELGQRLGISGVHAWRLKQIAYKHLQEVLMIDGRILALLNNG